MTTYANEINAIAADARAKLSEKDGVYAGAWATVNGKRVRVMAMAEVSNLRRKGNNVRLNWYVNEKRVAFDKLTTTIEA
jgi:hypothetical protein